MVGLQAEYERCKTCLEKYLSPLAQKAYISIPIYYFNQAMGLNAKPDETLTEMHEKYQRVALNDYKDEVTLHAAFDINHYRLLQDLINNSWSKLKKINARREGPAVLFNVNGFIMQIKILEYSLGLL